MVKFFIGYLINLSPDDFPLIDANSIRYHGFLENGIFLVSDKNWVYALGAIRDFSEELLWKRQIFSRMIA